MKEMRRVLSFLLVLVMVLGMFPPTAFAEGTETVLDAAIFCSDVHGSTSDLTSVLEGVKTSGVDYSSIGFVGDTCLTVDTTTSTVQSALGDKNINVMFSYAASHDTENSADINKSWDYSGEVKGVSSNYLVYTIRETDMQNTSDAATAAPAFTTWYNGLSAAKKALPIFIMSHRPLHKGRDDNNGAAAWYDVIEAAANTSDIVVFWGHNHTSETQGKTREADYAAYYVPNDGTESITVANGGTEYPNFTYMNAGYINANGQRPKRIRVATTVQITASNLIFQDYTTTGAYTDASYSHNVTVAREHAVYPTQLIVSGTNEYTVGENYVAPTVYVQYSDGSKVETTDYTVTLNGAEVTGVDTSVAGTYVLTYKCTVDGFEATTEFTITVKEAETPETTTPTTVPEETSAPETTVPETTGSTTPETPTVTGISVTAPTKTWYERNETLDTTGMVVTATYSDGTTATITEGYEVSAVDMTTSGEKTVTVTYEGYTATFTVTVNPNTVSCEAGYMSDGTLVLNNDTMSATGNGLTGMSAVWNDTVDKNLADANTFGVGVYKPYDVSLEGYTAGEEVTITMVVYGITAEDLVVYYVEEDGTLTEVTVTSAVTTEVDEYDYYTTLTFTTNRVGTFVVGNPVAADIPADATLARVEIVKQPDVLEYFIIPDATDSETLYLDITGLEINAIYSDGTDEYEKPLEWDKFKPDENDGYGLAMSQSMTVAGVNTITVSYQDATPATFTVTVYQEYFTDESSNVTVQIQDFYEAELTVTPNSDAEFVANAMAELKVENFASYDIDLSGHTTGQEVTVTLPVPENVTNPAVFYVPEDGSDPVELTFEVNDDGTVSFTTDHFSTYVVVEKLTDGTEIETGGNDQTVDSTQTTTTVWKLTDTITAGKTYLIVNTNSASTSAHALGHNGTDVADDSVTVYNDGTNTYILDSDVDATSKWTFGGSSGAFTPYNEEYYVTYTFDSQQIYGDLYYYRNFVFAINTTPYTWSTEGTNLHFTKAQVYTYYLTYSNGWTLSEDSANVYFYTEETITAGTEGGTYTAEGTNITDAAALSGQTVDLSSTLTFTTSSGATSTPSGWTATYTLVTDKGTPGVISSINGNVATLSGTAGTAVVKVTYTNGTHTVWDEFIVTATAVTYSMDITVDGKVVDEHTVTGVTSSTTLPLGAVSYSDPEGFKPGFNETSGSWVMTSSNEAVATINNTSGVVSFKGVEGSTTITATYSWTDANGNTQSITDSIVLKAIPPVYGFSITDSATQLKVGVAYTFIATPTADGTALTGQTITWSASPDDASIAHVHKESGVVTGVAVGTAYITATWTDPKGVVHTDTVEVVIQDAVYALELHEPTYTEVAEDATFDSTITYFIKQEDGTYLAATGITEFAEGTTYYTQSTQEITAPIIIKNVNPGDAYQDVWAVIYADGVDIGKLTDEQLTKLTYISNNTNIATVDKTTGHITFQGGTGTVTITCMYEYADGKYVTDAVVFSVSADSDYVPEDGTNDFPEYPNEGAIRFDKTATAVGNFSQTGIVQVELSMTGVPYTTGNEIDVVLMIDLTGSMYSSGGNNSSAIDRVTPTAEAAQAFVESIVKNTDGTFNQNRIGVYVFHVTSKDNSAGTTETIYDLGTVTEDNYDDIISDLSATNLQSMVVSGGTPYNTALAKCESVLDTARSAEGYSRSQYCVFMTDGCPTAYQYSASASYSTENIQGMFTGTNYNTRGTGYYYEYYSTQMKYDGVTVYTVGLGLNNTNGAWSGKTAAQCFNAAKILLNDISGPAKEKTNDTGTALNKFYTGDSYTDIEGKYFFSVDDSNADKMSTVFSSIAQKILDAAKDVKVTDKMADEFTMVFEAPNTTVSGELPSGQEFYMEVKDYALTPVYTKAENLTAFQSGVTYYTLSGTTYTKATSYTAGTTYYTITDYTRGAATSLMKVYLGTNTDGSYYAASDASGTAHATPAFNTTALGSLYYWTTVKADGDSGISVVGADGTTYYFISTGKGTHNMASGAYASGTKTPYYGKVESPVAANISTYYVKNADGTYSSAANTTFDASKEYYICSTTSTDLIIATPYFVYNAATKILVWTAEKLSSSELALSYFLYLDKSGGWAGAEGEVTADTYDTNEYAYLNYTNFNERPCEQEFPVPKITWNGAQVSYVFYLVNEQGQPVNRAGRVVPFSEAVYVTDVFTYAVVWNDEEQVASLEAEYLAEDLVPDVYKLYDADATYDILVYEDEEGDNLNNHFIIGGTTNTTYAFNTKADATKYTASGAYAATTQYKRKEYANVTVTDNAGSYTGTYEQVKVNGAAIYGADDKGAYTIVYDTATKVSTGFDFSNTTVAFAVVWVPQLVEDVVVIDFGLDVVIDVTTNDALASGVVGIRANAPSDVAINEGTYTAAKALTTDVKIGTLKVGTASVENLTSVRFSLDKTNGMQLSEPVTFYYESDVNYYNADNVLTNTSMYSSVTVIPATTIYYEDGFVTFESYTKTDGAWNKDTTTQWTTEGTAVNATQQQDRPGESQISESLDHDNIYGYDPAYDTCSKYSMGSAAKIHVDATHYGTAGFSFYGTGFDIIALTSNKTGIINVRVYDKDGKVVVNKTVDTYYGYTYGIYECTYKLNENNRWELTNVGDEIDPDNYTGTIYKSKDELTATANGSDTVTGAIANWKAVETAEDESNALYQVPVLKVSDLDYGAYTAAIRVSYYSVLDHTSEDGYDMYLDAIRIYDPAGTNSVANGAHKQDKEAWPEYTELRDLIISAEDFNSLDDTTVKGIVFIDGGISEPDIQDYTNYGPNNELYLTDGQAVAGYLDAGDPKAIHLGIKTVGGEGSVEVYGVDSEGNKTVVVAETISTATDMYYDITALNKMNLVIKNTGTESAMISITNIKCTYDAEPVYPVSMTLADSGATVTYSDKSTKLVDATKLTAVDNGDGTATYTYLEKVNSVTYSVSATSEAAAAAATAMLLEEDTSDSLYLFTVNRSVASAATMSLRANEEEPTVPETTVPEETVPETTEPEVTEPEVTEPEETEPETPAFEPEKLSVYLSRDSVKKGTSVIVTVRTSADVEMLTVNGVAVTSYSYSRWTGTKTWVVTVKAEQVGEMAIDVVGYNTDGQASTTVSNTITVTERSGSFFDDLRDWFRR